MIKIIAALIFAMSLCADCFAVSVCSSVTLKKLNFRTVGYISLVFAIIQSGFLLIGYEFGGLFVGYVENAAKWIGFGLLLYVGGSMVKEALETECESRDLNGLKNVIVGGIATSIDALAVGISMSMSRDSVGDIMLKAAAVFLMTVISVIVGMYFGHRIGHRFGKIAEFIGGLVLVGIGASLLF